MKDISTANADSVRSDVIENITTYKVTISIIFGLLGFAINFYPVDFVFYGSYRMSFLLGLLFPTLITLAWGWKYGLLSALCGGCQTMWILWMPQSGYGPFVSVPPFTLWIVWIGWFSRTRYNIYLGEVIFRLFNTVLLYTVFRWVFTLNVPPANVTMPLAIVHSIVFKEMVNGLFILFLAQGLLYSDTVRKFFKLPRSTADPRLYYIYTNAVILGGILIFSFVGERYIWSMWGTEFQQAARILGSLLLLMVGILCTYGTANVFAKRKTEDLIQAEERIEHLNAVLRAIRNINQLITRERGRDRLLKGACDNLILVETTGYHSAWIALFDESGGLAVAVEAGLGESFLPLVEQLKRGELPDCARRALSQADVVVTKDPLSTCADCPLAANCGGRGAMTVRLEYEGKVYGLSSVSIPADFTADEEERALFKEVAGDIAFALHSIELEKERKQAQETLRLLSAAVEQTTEGIALIDLEGNLLFVNETFAALHGYTPEELAGEHLSLFHTPEQMPSVEAANRQIQETGEFSGEIWHVRRDGTVFPTSMHNSLLRDEAGNTVGIIGTLHDITERVRMEEALAASEALYRSTVDAVDDPIQVMNTNLEFILVNKAYAQWCASAGMEMTDVIGRNLFQVLPILPDRVRDEYRKVLETGEMLITEETTRVEGRDFITETRKIPVFEDASITRIVAIVRDITEQVQAEEELKQTLTELADSRTAALNMMEDAEQSRRKAERANEDLRREIAERKRIEVELERSNADLEQFAYVASHDLQEPLRMVSSYVQLLARRYEGQLDADADDFIAYAVDGTNRMQTLINDLLAYSRVGTRGKPFEPADCEATLDQVLTNLQVAIEESGAVVTHDGLPTVMADSSQLAQLFQNLIENGTKFHGKEPPRVHVSAKRLPLPQAGEGRGGGRNEWVFSVRDNGIGIAPEFFERIFIIFQRLHTREEHPGTGIGLAICKRIMERHGGRIWVESQPGEGSTFFFTMRSET